jgi:cytidylate kinase
MTENVTLRDIRVTSRYSDRYCLDIASLTVHFLFVSSSEIVIV